jgi:prolipoprotein diacylglyceryltransferase
MTMGQLLSIPAVAVGLWLIWNARTHDASSIS